MDAGQQVEKYIKARMAALNDLNQADKELVKLGVKFGIVEEGIPNIEVGPHYLPQFSYHLEEYEWEATYKDGSKLHQFDISGERHFGDIDQKKLKKIRIISNFDDQTDNSEKRIILSLDWEKGQFELYNGFVSPEDRQILFTTEEKSEKKLILFRRIRFGQTMQISQTVVPTKDIYFYKRYYLGYETEKKKTLFCLHPNGIVTLEYGHPDQLSNR